MSRGAARALFGLAALLFAAPACAQEVVPVRYACEDGSAVVASYGPPGEAMTLSFDGGPPVALAPAPAASGARYTGGGMQWWIKGDTATLAPLVPGADVTSDPGLACATGTAAAAVAPTPGLAAYACDSGTRIEVVELPRDTLVLWRDDEDAVALTALPTAGYGRLWAGGAMDWRRFDDGTAVLTTYPEGGGAGVEERCARRD